MAFSENYVAAYLREVGLEANDRIAVRKAYETAHRIREFEIDLYWKRSAYMWAMQAALIGIAIFAHLGGNTRTIVAFNVNYGLQLVTESVPSPDRLFATLLISSLAFVIAALWACLEQGAKFWQNYWERHIDILGCVLRENTYQVYPVKGDGNLTSQKDHRPYSVSRINSYVIYCFMVFWVILFIWCILSLASHLEPSFAHKVYALLVVCIGMAFLFFFCVIQFRGSWAYNGMRMDGLGTLVKDLPEGQNDPRLYQRTRRPPKS